MKAGLNRMFMKLKVSRAIALCALALTACVNFSAKQRNATAQEAKRKHLNWSPPNVDAPLPSLAANPPCNLPKVLENVGSHALELTANLENFTAEEQIKYEKWSYSGVPQENDTGMFHYVFAFEPYEGDLVSREYRSPWKGGHSFPASAEDTGQVALGLIFHPNMQTDYEMNCEGLDQWKGQRRGWSVFSSGRISRVEPCSSTFKAGKLGQC